MQRFVEAVHEVPHVNHELLASIIQQNLLPERLKESIVGKPPNTMEDLLMRSQKYIRIEESNASNPSLSGKRKGREEERDRKKKEEHKHLPPTGFTHYTIWNVNQGPSRQPQDSTFTQTRNADNLPITGVIAVILGGPAARDLANARKALVQATRGNHWQVLIQVYNFNSEKQEEISFNLQDMDPMRNQNNDALVISATLSNFLVKKILVDSGSSVDIIFYDVYVQLGIDNAQLRKVNTPLIDFSGEMIEPLGEVMLSLSLSFFPKRSTKMVKFLMVKAPSAYNIILRRLSLNLLQAIASTFHMKLKFPTSIGVGEAVGDELMARECYANTLMRSREKLDGKTHDVKGKRVTIGIEHEVRDTP
ncbi:UNVERIFIED_CONTAM: hypothetical protein Sradi_2633900 [Sesamum radiatum]|uniref:Uncharacterized protein n=1 Tax=Sesamum radiatum TaxID=300843 RepID=A0AAW2S740_SESRA